MTEIRTGAGFPGEPGFMQVRGSSGAFLRSAGEVAHRPVCGSGRRGTAPAHDHGPPRLRPVGVGRRHSGEGGRPVKVLGINALFHDPAAALVIDGETVAAAEEERFSRRKHGKRPVPFSAWELPELAARWCLEAAGLDITDVDAVAYSYDPSLARPAEEMGLDDPWDHLRQTYAQRAPGFLAASLPG